MTFLSTLSLRRATRRPRASQSTFAFLSTLSLRRATSDSTQELAKQVFLSTLSLRRATDHLLHLVTQSRYFYPRSPCGERLTHRSAPAGAGYFYPRSPCGERPWRLWGLFRGRNFYPRSPCGERRDFHNLNLDWILISIHALLAESDIITVGAGTMTLRFLSTLSLRRATKNAITAAPQQEFLSTLSLRRATDVVSVQYRCKRISIHALLAESDFLANLCLILVCHFYPRSPCGERQTLQD